MEPWGYSTHLDLYDCNPIAIRSNDMIINYVSLLCKLMVMREFGECIVSHFGDDEKVKGYTFVQMIETSLISGHLVELTNQAHIDIFSCKEYDTHMAHQFTVSYFDAKKSKIQTLER